MLYYVILCQLLGLHIFCIVPELNAYCLTCEVGCCFVDSELCHKFTQILVDKKQVTMFIVISSFCLS